METIEWRFQFTSNLYTIKNENQSSVLTSPSLRRIVSSSWGASTHCPLRGFGELKNGDHGGEDGEVGERGGARVVRRRKIKHVVRFLDEQVDPLRGKLEDLAGEPVEEFHRTLAFLYL